ncbi:MAG TPA: glycerate kinase [Candidatus Nitrosotalea sp.]|nr:glycerate kinase [Candidatus Nitrosotalea sp.]
MIVVVAPNPFKGVLSAPDAAAAMARGVRRADPTAQLRLSPMADGGEGTLQALLGGRPGLPVTVEGPLGGGVPAQFGLLPGDGTAVVELAQSSGGALLPRRLWDPARTSTYGFGQMLEAARRSGVARIIAAIGGSITNDGGAGMAQALGFRLLDRWGDDLPRGGMALRALERIDASGLDPHWPEVEVLVAADVTNPLTGPQGATMVYAAQKGADESTRAGLELALLRFEELIGRELAQTPGAGAAGGVGAGLAYFLGARICPGAALVADAARLDQVLVGAGLVITGEGRVDAQTAQGKGPIEVARRAARLGIPVLLVAGSRGTGWERVLDLGVQRVVSLDGSEPHPAWGPADALSAAVEGALR